jgi:hypothetical protein
MYARTRGKPIKVAKDLVCIDTAVVVQGHHVVGFKEIIDQASNNIIVSINRAQMDVIGVKRWDSGQHGQRLRHNRPALSKMGSTGS